VIWSVGARMLGPYTLGADAHAGPFSLLADFYIGLGHGWISYWLVVVGPALLLLLLRLLVALIRHRPDESH